MVKSFNNIKAVSKLVIIDSLRRNALLGVFLLAFGGIVGGLFFFKFIPRDIGRVSSDYVLSITWLTGIILIFFHGVQVIAWDNERGALHTFLARPITRSQYALGLFIGIATLLFILNIAMAGLGWMILGFIKRTVETYYFEKLSLPFFMLAICGIYWIQITITAIIVLFSSFVRGSFPVFLLTLSYYLCCTGLPVVRESVRAKAEQSINYDSLNFFLKWLMTLFPDFSKLDYKTLVTTFDPIPNSIDIIIPFFISTAYIIIALWTSCYVYEKRDLQ